MIKVFDYFFFCRPVLFFPAWSTMIIAYTSTDTNESGMLLIKNTELILNMITFAFVMASTFVINQIFDIKTDKINKKLFFLGDGLISIKQATYFSICLMTASFVLAAYISDYVLLLTILFFIVAGVLYNIKPFQWKNRWHLGALLNLIGGLLAFYYGLNKYNYMNHLPELIILTMFNFNLYIYTTLPDSEGDKESDKQTIGNIFGFYWSLILILVCSIIMIFFSINYPINSIFLTISITALVAVLYSLINHSKPQILMIIKIQLFLESIIVVYFVPDFLILMILMYLGGRYFYKKRFNLNYPNLINE